MQLLGILLLVLSITGATFVRRNHPTIVKSGSKNIVAERARRSVFKFGKLIYKGVKARNALLQGTKKVALYPSEGINGAKQFRYTKPGSWAQAQRDFYAIQPTNIERGNMGQTHVGSIGDREFVLQQKGPFDLPSIKIFTVRLGAKEPQLTTEEIIYINRPT